MSNNIEIEAKILVNEKDFNKLLKHFNVKEEDKIIQTNHYIDSNNRDLKRFGFALRIREKKNEYEFTLKAPLSEGLLEKSEFINKEDYDAFKKDNIFPNGNLKNFLEMVGIKTDTLKILTSLTTERYDIQYGKDSLLSLDKSTYNGHTDYEIEMEDTAIAIAEQNLKDICEAAQIKYVPNTKSKQARAMETM